MRHDEANAATAPGQTPDPTCGGAPMVEWPNSPEGMPGWMCPQCGSTEPGPEHQGTPEPLARARAGARIDPLSNALDSPGSEADFVAGLVEHYRQCRRASMAKLRATWEAGRWLSNALDTAKREAWPVDSLIADLRKSGRCKWRRSTIYAYAQLGREDWRAVKPSGSVRKALAVIRERNRRNRTPEEQAKLDRINWNPIMTPNDLFEELQAWAAKVDALKRRNRQLEREVLELRDTVKAHAEAEQAALARAEQAEAKAFELRAGCYSKRATTPTARTARRP